MSVRASKVSFASCQMPVTVETNPSFKARPRSFAASQVAFTVSVTLFLTDSQASLSPFWISWSFAFSLPLISAHFAATEALMRSSVLFSVALSWSIWALSWALRSATHCWSAAVQRATVAWALVIRSLARALAFSHSPLALDLMESQVLLARVFARSHSEGEPALALASPDFALASSCKACPCRCAWEIVAFLSCWSFCCLPWICWLAWLWAELICAPVLLRAPVSWVLPCCWLAPCSWFELFWAASRCWSFCAFARALSSSPVLRAPASLFWARVFSPWRRVSTETALVSIFAFTPSRTCWTRSRALGSRVPSRNATKVG